MPNSDAASHTSLLVTGAGGQLGSAVVEAAAVAGVNAIGFGSRELDVTDLARVREVVERVAPTSVVHCAAWTDVDGAETDRAGAFRVNETGSRNVAQVCAELGVHLVAVSTDYVFPGDSSDGYAEDDAPGPINVYGESKLAGELAIRDELGDAACIARTAWLFSAQPPNFVQTMVRLTSQLDAIDVVDDQRGNPTWCGHVARALVVCAQQRLGGTHHLVDSPDATWRDLAKAVAVETGSACDVRATTSDAFPRPAKRAPYSMLRVTRADTPAMGDWRDGVHASVTAPVAH